MKKTLVIGNAATMRDGSSENTGNLVHAISARRLLSNYANFNISKPWTSEQLDYLKNNFQNVLFVAANTIRDTSDAGFLKIQETMAENLKNLKLPIVTLGLGAQAGINDLPKDLNLNSATLDLIRTISENSNIFGVRGEYTVDVLRANGIKNAIPMGCPSVYYHTECASSHPYDFKLLPPQLDSGSKKIVFNYTSFWREYGIYNTIKGIKGAYLIAQGEFYEQRLSQNSLDEEAPPKSYEAVFNKNADLQTLFIDVAGKNYRKFFQLDDWLNFVRDAQISYGSRFHGNMASLIAGVPSVWFAHDSRTLELCEYHGLPKIITGEKPLDIKLEDVVSAVDYGPFRNKYSSNRERLKNYLNLAGIENCL